MAHILVCGGGLAAWMTTAALARQLPPDIRLTLALVADTDDSDLFYGSVTGPSAYVFNLAAGVEEPALVLASDTAFSWGTRYADWGGRAWTQCFALPLPVADGVVFHQYLTASGAGEIEPFLISAKAAARRVFAHPPRGPGETGRHPLARADYGYQFDAPSYARLFAAAIPPGRVEVVEGELAGVEAGGHGIGGVRLTDGRTLSADLYVDCTGPQAKLLSRLCPDFTGDRTICIGSSTADPTGGALRTVSATERGWHSETPLRVRTLQTHAFHPDLPDTGPFDRTAHATLGKRRRVWAGNCVAIGHAAAVVEPLTPAPMMLLERDIERLLSLIPNGGDMAVEQREYCRRFDDDHDHAELFNRALLAVENAPDTPYWRAIRAMPMPEKLARKIDLFGDRGVLVAYDLEPFHPEDWTILHLGMGRRPARHDRLADRAPPERVGKFLNDMKAEIARVVATMPDDVTYRKQLELYLRQKAR